VSSVRYELGFYIPEAGILHSHRCDNFRSSINQLCGGITEHYLWVIYTARRSHSSLVVCAQNSTRLVSDCRLRALLSRGMGGRTSAGGGGTRLRNMGNRTCQNLYWSSGVICNGMFSHCAGQNK
jgi:hypothetical protein